MKKRKPKARRIDPEAPSKTVVEPELVSMKDAELLSGISRYTWRLKAYRGQVTSVKIGRLLKLPLSEIRRVIAEGTRPRRDSLPAGAPAAKQSRNSEAIHV